MGMGGASKIKEVYRVSDEPALESIRFRALFRRQGSIFEQS
jgi:hypothetical protein